MNYNQEMIKKIRKSTKDLVDSSPDSVGPSSKANKNSPKYLNMKDNMFNRTLRTSQNIKPRKDTSQETHSTDKEVRNSVGSKSKLRQTFFKDKQQVDIRKKDTILNERETNGSASQSPRNTILPISNSKAALGTSNNPHSQQIMGSNNASGVNNTARNTLSREAKSRSQSKNNLKNHANKFSTNDIHQ